MTKDEIKQWVFDYGMCQDFDLDDAVNMLNEFLKNHNKPCNCNELVLESTCKKCKGSIHWYRR